MTLREKFHEWSGDYSQWHGVKHDDVLVEWFTWFLDEMDVLTAKIENYQPKVKSIENIRIN